MRVLKLRVYGKFPFELVLRHRGRLVSYGAIPEPHRFDVPTISKHSKTSCFRFRHEQKISGLGRATILEISSDSLETEVISFEDPLHFQSCLDGTRDASDNGIQRLCILEDVVSDYVESIGSCLMIDPFFFAIHLQLVNLAGSYQGAH
jgi:hypothetical protein